MMVHMGKPTPNLSGMPRGGPDACWLDRLLETDRPEYLDRPDVDADVKRSVVRALDRAGELFREHDRNTALVLSEVAEVADPAILELGAGHGGLSRKLLEQHPTATVTVSDINADSVSAIAASDLGQHPRAVVRTIDATDIDMPDGTFDLAVFALSFHHLPPESAAQVLAEGTRVAKKLVIIDLARPPAPLHLIRVATMAPLAPIWPFAHDGMISSLRSYSQSALQALGAHVGVRVEVRSLWPDRQMTVARRP